MYIPRYGCFPQGGKPSPEKKTAIFMHAIIVSNIHHFPQLFVINLFFFFLFFLGAFFGLRVFSRERHFGLFEKGIKNTTTLIQKKKKRERKKEGKKERQKERQEGGGRGGGGKGVWGGIRSVCVCVCVFRVGQSVRTPLSSLPAFQSVSATVG